ncbi:transporter, partial [Cellulomonas bogoriensis 69B4 = DSM 16987]
MSSQLYRLGRAMARHRRAVLTSWLALLVAVGALAGLSGGQPQDELTIPGTEAQEGLDVLDQRFPEAGGTTAQILFVAPGGDVRAVADQVRDVLAEIADAPDVEYVGDPLDGTDPLAVSDDGSHALTTVRLGSELGDLDPGTVPALEAAAERGSAGTDLEVHIGGSVYAETSVHITVAEVLGVVVAMVVLAITFGSFLAAGMPLLTAVIGVGITMAAILALAALTPVSSTAPTLALMIGLAVGIDYALFVLSRHRSQLATGMSVEESIARSVATAGSAVVFAGATVVIALCGLFVVGIPFLTVMGLTAALAVTIAVVIALTGLPALVAVAGERLRPRPGSRAAVRALVEQHGDSPDTPGLVGSGQGGASGATSARTMGSRWVHLVTRRPLLTVLVVVLGLGAMAIPAKDLALGLPDNGSAEPGSPERVTYDLIDEAYGPGFNATLVVTVDIIRSTDPLGVMADLAEDLRGFEGVAQVGMATPNPT